MGKPGILWEPRRVCGCVNIKTNEIKVFGLDNSINDLVKSIENFADEVWKEEVHNKEKDFECLANKVCCRLSKGKIKWFHEFFNKVNELDDYMIKDNLFTVSSTFMEKMLLNMLKEKTSEEWEEIRKEIEGSKSEESSSKDSGLTNLFNNDN